MSTHTEKVNNILKILKFLKELEKGSKLTVLYRLLLPSLNLWNTWIKGVVLSKGTSAVVYQLLLLLVNSYTQCISEHIQLLGS